MVTSIKKGASKDDIRKLFERIATSPGSRKGFNAYKFCGIVKFREDGLRIQKHLRDEWE